MKAYTDYPLSEVTTSVSSYEVEILAYDRDKYATVKVENGTKTIKVGYLFKDRELKKMFSKAEWFSLPISVDRPRPTKHQISSELKKFRSKRTYYALCVKDQPSEEISSLKEALKKFKKLNSDRWLSKRTTSGKCFSSTPIVSVRNGELTVSVDRRDRAIVKSSRLGWFYSNMLE